MRKLALILGLVVASWSASAQVNQLNVYVGPSLGNTYGGMFNLDYEIQMFDDNLTIGPSIGIGSARYKYMVDNVTYHESYMVINPAVVGHYYFDYLIPDMPDHFDLFAKAKLGMRYVGGNYAYSGAVLDLNLQAGGRYYFNSTTSLYLAIGYAYAPMNLGVSIQL